MKANEMLDKALDFIVETQEDNDYICEQMIEECVGNYCEKIAKTSIKNVLSCFCKKYIIKNKL